MMRLAIHRSTGLLAVTACCILPIVADAELVRNLKIGDRGEDVRELQILLNRDPASLVALAGPGSPGNETDYFGTLTQDAVMRLQGIHADVILMPLGITAPTGFVGAQTRLFLRQKTSALTPAPTPHATATPSPAPQAAISPPMVSSVSPAVVTKSTTTLTIAGTHFTPSANTVIVSSESPSAFTNITSPDGRTLTILFHFTAADALRQQLTPALASGKFTVLSEAIAKNIQQRTSPTGNAQIPVRLGVKNANGEAVPKQFLIDMTEILKEIGSSAP